MWSPFLLNKKFQSFFQRDVSHSAGLSTEIPLCKIIQYEESINRFSVPCLRRRITANGTGIVAAFIGGSIEHIAQKQQRNHHCFPRRGACRCNVQTNQRRVPPTDQGKLYGHGLK